MKVQNYEEVEHFPIDPEMQEKILLEQNECSFVWGPKDNWAVGVIMSYVWRDGKFWLTASSQRARIYAVRRDPRVSLVISSVGTSFGPAKSITVKGHVRILDDDETKARVLPQIASVVLPGADELQARFVNMMDSPRRVVLEVTPEKWITFDAGQMMVASIMTPDAQ
jgi:nitroimidazol reductase NimA-like FMN-containing flavoprotein (pyridoxamine 5'-phosphate oxidase superfamily)